MQPDTQRYRCTCSPRWTCSTWYTCLRCMCNMQLLLSITKLCLPESGYQTQIPCQHHVLSVIDILLIFTSQKVVYQYIFFKGANEIGPLIGDLVSC